MMRACLQHDPRHAEQLRLAFQGALARPDDRDAHLMDASDDLVPPSRAGRRRLGGGVSDRRPGVVAYAITRGSAPPNRPG